MEFIFGILILIFDIWAIVTTLSSSASTAAKIGWTLLILFLPVVGLIIWYFAGPKGRSTSFA